MYESTELETWTYDALNDALKQDGLSLVVWIFHWMESCGGVGGSYGSFEIEMRDVVAIESFSLFLPGGDYVLNNQGQSDRGKGGDIREERAIIWRNLVVPSWSKYI